MVEASDGHGHVVTFINPATVSFDLTRRLGAYAELLTELSTETGAKWIVAGDLGLTYAVTHNLSSTAALTWE